MAENDKPKSIEIRTYQVGFGDCFLLSFKYATRDRHVLIDFGSMALPHGAKKSHMIEIARQIKKDCGGSLDMVVATHRHEDHISGFATNKKGDAAGNLIASCKPRLVVQPWTEDPRAPMDAKTAPMTPRHAFTASLDHMHAVAGAALTTARALRRAAPRDVVRELDYLGRDNIKNQSAVENLMTMARNRYVKYGDTLPVARILPGVKVHVLGPPSLEQSADIAAMRSRDEAEFWHLQAMASTGAAEGRALFPEVAMRRTPIEARWFRSRLCSARAETLLSIVRILDRQMNNTSLILLFEIGGRLLLFPGDAQIENWRYALAQKKHAALLRNVDVYKVGHHGSLNATPKSLWALFARKGAAGSAERLKTLLSTLAGVHGHADAGTEVPREKLVKALSQESELLTTPSFKESELCRVVTLRRRGGGLRGP